MNARISVGITDGHGLHGTARTFASLAAGATLTEMQTGLLPWAGLLNGVTAGLIKYVHVTVALDISGLTPNTPDESIDIQRCAVLKFPVTGDSSPYDFVVPALLPSLQLGNKLVLTEDGAIDSLADVMEAAFELHAANDSHFTNEDYDNLTATAGGFRSFRKFGKQLAASKDSGV